MKRRTEMVLIGVVAGVAVIFAIRHGAGPGGGSGGGRACCPSMSGLNVWPTIVPAGTNVMNTNSALTGSESTTNRQQ
ncbi:MAG: hypothetical protein NT154_41440 [Verrucomicrobia bacterium]|nr:hypothetical protein [Verrucomicrobiota bacterium]